ncbi:MAG: alpha/beta hydrolase [Sporocytophaga sp.]|uniref:alpha/beta hydrolase n=1 Tax=Sporocytophaga sp. TaxID=2231183 RepID=UPI001B1A66E3|nr:alpha/beta hydrolase [Sporocytophaga sp.]MBO9699235.1 alpha/beta hydrolase [Sporocytophaga sp.]
MKSGKLISTILFVTFTTLQYTSFSQTYFPYDKYNGTNLKWTEALQLKTSDTTIIMVTVRDKVASSQKLFSDKSIRPDQYTTLICLWKNPDWYIMEVPSLEVALQKSGCTKEVVTFIHGDGKDFPLAINRAADIKLLFDIPVIAFDVPSLLPTSNKIKNFYNSKHNYKESSSLFTEYVKALGKIKEHQPNLSLVLHMHSLGNYVYMESLKKNRLDKCPLIFETILMNAAAVKQKRHKGWLEKSHIQKNIYITYNKTDHTLNGAHFITFRKQLGERLKKPLASNGHYINFQTIAHKEHNYYRNTELFRIHPNLKLFYIDILHGRHVPLEDESRFSKRKDGKGFDIR